MHRDEKDSSSSGACPAACCHPQAQHPVSGVQPQKPSSSESLAPAGSVVQRDKKQVPGSVCAAQKHRNGTIPGR